MSSLLKPSDIYDAFADDYREYSNSKNSYLSSIDNLIIKNFKNKSPTILDYGSGDGVRGAKIFKELKSKTLIQADISDNMLEKCLELNVASEVWDVKNSNWYKNKFRPDLILCLWNVLGHLKTFEERVDNLEKLNNLLNNDGNLVFDVNNRHFIGYGKYKSLMRRLLDYIYPNYKRGDIKFDWKIGEKVYPSNGHLFTVGEVKELLEKSNFKIDSIFGVDYFTGKVSSNISSGQIFVSAPKKN